MLAIQLFFNTFLTKLFFLTLFIEILIYLINYFLTEYLIISNFIIKLLNKGIFN